MPASALRDSGVTVVRHAGLGAYRGVWFFVRGRSAVVSAPPEWAERLERACGAAAAQDLLSAATAARALGRAAGASVGPSFQGWLPADRFRPAAADGVERVRERARREAILREVRASCPPIDWEHGGIDPDGGELWASFEAERAVALGQLRPHARGAVDPCVVTQPAQRGRGHALRVVGAMSAQALAAGHLVLYQTLLSNAPALALARRLGFEPYATLLAVRLAPDAA